MLGYYSLVEKKRIISILLTVDESPEPIVEGEKQA